MKWSRLPVLVAGLVLALVAFNASLLIAQNTGHYEMQSLTVGSGEDPLSSGLGLTLRLANRTRFVEFVAQNEQAWFVYGPKIGTGNTSGFIAASIGIFQGAPWVGPMLKLEHTLGSVAGQSVSIGTMQWPVLNGGTPKAWQDVPNPEAVLFGYFGEVHLNVGPLGLSYAVLNYLHDPWNFLPGVSYTQSVRSDLGVTANATWNSNTKKWLLWMGASWAPSQSRR